jgi:hypothetical protein
MRKLWLDLDGLWDVTVPVSRKSRPLLAVLLCQGQARHAHHGAQHKPATAYLPWLRKLTPLCGRGVAGLPGAGFGRKKKVGLVPGAAAGSYACCGFRFIVGLSFTGKSALTPTLSRRERELTQLPAAGGIAIPKLGPGFRRDDSYSN